MGRPVLYTFKKRGRSLSGLTFMETLNVFIALLPFDLDGNRARAHRILEVIAADSREGLWVKRLEFCSVVRVGFELTV